MTILELTNLYSSVSVVITGSWYKGDVMSLIDNAMKTGGTTPLSDAFTINGQPGDYKPCSKGTYKLND